ncbi:MAG: HipA domain-containing protein [Actinomycetota bacterium]|nr:HipA domain-containing protein [Actinomycetota bacterium]
MTSEQPGEAYAWVWLPGATEPVVAGRLEQSARTLDFNYGRSYLARSDRIALFEPELPLVSGRIRPTGNLAVAGVIRDAGPDAWGQRIILRRLTGAGGRDTDVDQLSLLTYLLEAPSDRIGALDFQSSSGTYEHRPSVGTLEEMVSATVEFLAGGQLSPDVSQALLAGSSVGGARPKVLLDDGGRKLIAKLSQDSDPYPVVKAEGVAMELASRVGLTVAPVEVRNCLGRDVLLVERFDRTAIPGQRRLLVSAMTVLGVNEWGAIHSGYWELADAIRARFSDVDVTLRELFSRITFNICVGNTDDHARNHSAFWDGGSLTLTPAYDICPQLRSGQEAEQALAIRPDGWRYSQLAGCLDAAKVYHLTPAEAWDIIDHQVSTILSSWPEAAERARLTAAERDAMWHTQILNPYALYDWPRRP